MGREEERSDPWREFFGFGNGREVEIVRREDQWHKESFVFFSHWNENAAARHQEGIMGLRN